MILFFKRATDFQFNYPILQVVSWLAISSLCSSSGLLTFNFITLLFEGSWLSILLNYSSGGLLTFNFITLFYRRAPDFQFHHPILQAGFWRAPDFQFHHPILQAGFWLSISSPYSPGRLLIWNFIILFFRRAPDFQFHHPILQEGSWL